MGNCFAKRKTINPGSALDRVISQASSDDCVLYRLADYKKGGRLLEEYFRGGGREVERLILEEFAVFTYNNGKGMQITRTEYLKWKYRNVNKDQMVIQMDTKSPFDPLKKWQDHEACWQMAFRGSLGESLLHVLIMCDTKSHTRIAKILLKCFPKLALDVVEGEEYLGASALHLAIAYSNNELVNILVGCGANINQRAIGSFFQPRDQQVINPPGPGNTDYEGLAYLGEYPLAWSACLGNETVYNRLLDHGASPNLQDNFGNMILHMVVVCNQLGMFGYALRHPRLPAQDGIVNAANLTPLTLACKLARSTIFREMLELTCIEFWRYSNITCSAYPLNALDTIKPSGETNWNSALMIILNGTKSEHLDMLEGGIIQRLLEEKWKTFARNQFVKRLGIMLLQLITMSVIIYMRPCFCGPKGMHLDDPSIRKQLWEEFFATDAQSIIRYCFELIVLIEVISYVVVQQGDEILNQGLKSFMKGLAGNPPKSIFLVANILFLLCVPCRISYFFSADLDLKARVIEDELLAYAAAGSWFMMLFFAGALKLTGPFVVMIYKMISGDMFTFSIIYGVMLLGFTQAFYFLYKRTAIPDKNSKFMTYRTTWMALFHMTLGEYDYGGMNLNIYSAMTKFVFLIFTIMLPILLLNMLIAMMGNTYSTVISMSEKEWVKAWAKIVIALERAVSQQKLKEHLYTYSVPLGGGHDGEENLGVMVIKSANKTKAKQRKGALSNWKRVGRVTIDALKKRGVSGEVLRREMWGLQTETSTPAKGPRKKGGLAAYDVKAGKTGTSDIPKTLADSIWDEDESSENEFDEDAHDGFGVLTGAIDQLTFTNDLDFSGDGFDEDQSKSRRPELASAEAANAKLELARKEEEERKARKKKTEMDNHAFIDEEELLLVAGISHDHDRDHDHDDDSDDNDATRNKSKTPKVIVQNDHYPDTSKSKDPKGGTTLPPLINTRYRPSSVKLRRLGSARRKAPRYGIAFADPPQNRSQPKTQTQPSVSNGVIPNENIDQVKKGKQVTKDQQLNKNEPTNKSNDQHVHNVQFDPLPPKAKEEINEGGEEEEETEAEAETEAETETETEAEAEAAAATETVEKDQKKAEQTGPKDEIEQEMKWAEKKSRKRNKVVPTSISVDEAPKQKRTPKDDSSVGLQSGTDSTREEVKAKEKRERPKTGVTPQEKMKSWSTDNITDMTNILPWDNEEGDIK